MDNDNFYISTWSPEDTLKFIRLFENEEVIWNPQHPKHVDRLAIHSAWKRIAKEMGVPMPEVKKKKDSILATYRKIVRKAIISGESHIVCNWFAFKSLDRFLRKIYVPRKTLTLPEGDDTSDAEQQSSSLVTADPQDPEEVSLEEDCSSMSSSGKKWREYDTIKFVQLYEKAECLWNFRHPAYKNRNARDKAIMQIIGLMNMPDFGVNELKNKIKNIRSTYQQEVNKIKRSRQGFGTDILEEYKTNLAWFPIADRFLGKVINSSKNPITKIEEDESSYFQSDQSSLYNLVETEMSNGDLDNEFEEKFVPFTVSVDQIKEEFDSDHYPTSTNVSKKRRNSYHPGYDIDMQSGESDVHLMNPHNNGTKDEWHHFGNNIACQLRQLPLDRALVCQKKIIEILTQERIEYLTEQKNNTITVGNEDMKNETPKEDA